MDNNIVIISDLPLSTTEDHVRAFFMQRNINIVSFTMATLNNKPLGYGTVVFPTVAAKLEALGMNGLYLHEKPVVMELLINNVRVPLYFFVRNLPPQARKTHVVRHFEDGPYAPDGVEAVVPLFENGNNKGFCFVYVRSHASLVAVLNAPPGMRLMNRVVRLEPGHLGGKPAPA